MTHGLNETIVRLWRLLPHGDGRRIGLLVLLMFIGSLLEMIGVGIIPVFVTILADPGPVLEHPWLQPVLGGLGIENTGRLLLAGAVTLMMVFVVKNTYIMAYHYLEARYIWNRYTWLASRLFRLYMQVPYPFHRQRNSASLLRNITEESRFLIQEVLGPLLRLCMSGLLVVTIFLLLLFIEPWITLGLLVIVGGGGTLFLQVLKQRISHYGLQAHHARLNVIQTVNEALEGIKDIRVLKRQRYFIDRLEEHVRRYSRSQTFWMTAVHANKPAIETVAVIGIMAIALTLWLQGRPVSGIIPVLALFGAATVRLLPDVKQILTYINSLRYFRESVIPVARDLRLADTQGFDGGDGPLAGGSAGDTTLNSTGYTTRYSAGNSDSDDEDESTGDPANHTGTTAGAGLTPPSPESIHEISFDSVTYSYSDGKRPVLRDITLTIAGGSFTGLAGPSGGGKTTLVDLLLGLLEPDSGTITINNKPLDTWYADHPEGVGYIPQTIFLIDDTLRRNIALGIPDHRIDEARLNRSIREARLTQLVEEMADGPDTVIGERGIRLSGGQRQRIGIARALYHEPSLIVMDEATSALDHATEREVMAAVELLRETRTVVIIAHRLSTVKNCDLICYLEDGKVTDHGKFGELAKRNRAFQI